MKMNYFKLSVAAVASSMFAASFLTSCSEEDLGFTSADVKKNEFAENFEATFGKVDENKSWDLYNTMTRTEKYDASEYTTLTRSAIEGYTEGSASDIISRPGSQSDRNGWYSVQDETLTWLKNNLVEGRNNTGLGKPFALKAPQNKFAIIPIYQGQAIMKWDLHFVDKTTNTDYNIWTKSQGIMYKNNEESQWTAPTNSSATSCSTIGKKYIMGQPMIFDEEKVAGHDFILYLDITEGGSTYAKTGTKQRSDEGMMLALNCPIPTNLDEYTQKDGSLIMLVGCEDADLSGSDWDINDVVFLIVGYPNIPDVVEYTKKRYMCEDLGNTYDFDFNDIVIDVTQTALYKGYIADDGTVQREEQASERTSVATLKHLCGTLPLHIKIGNTDFGSITDPTDHQRTYEELGASVQSTGYSIGWNPDVTKPVEGWEPDENNITIDVSNCVFPGEVVYTSNTREAFRQAVTDANGEVYTIDFPGTGKTPLIIAVDQTVNWMNENEHIPESWVNGDVFDAR